jgi:hypothetical protein
LAESKKTKYMKAKLLLLSAACAATLSANAVTVTSGFGTIPGASGDPYSGHGIPFNTSEYTTISGIGSPADTLTLGLAATAHGPTNPAPTDNGAGTYYVGTGLSGGRSLWNFDFYINSSQNRLQDYTFLITETGNGHSFTFNPLLIGDNVGAPSSAGNSESLDFLVFGLPLLYNANADATYTFQLDAILDGRNIGSDKITVVAGNGGTVPDGGATGVMVGACALGFAALRRKFRQ